MPGSMDLRGQTFSLCLINPTIVYIKARRAEHGKQYLFMLGYNYTKIKNCSLLGLRKDFTPLDIMTALGHELRHGIIELLRKKPMTVSQLSQELHIARSSIIRCVTILVDDTALLPSAQTGAEKYYELNRGYFQDSRTQLDRYCGAVLSDLERQKEGLPP